ncbi:methyltransferase family protein [Roseibium algae]|uniref:Isoprenylcysteine carboxylmethyltransferase family protein n=1 Tax=Roseibium algae TaxID=3123038 RepID=A0ABU8TK59_9HYPH
MQLKVPPVFVFLVAAVLLVIGAMLLPVGAIAFPGQTLLAAITALTGLGIGVPPVRKFRSRQTTVNPMNPENATSLVTSGIYRFSRNPMYLGLMLILLGLALYIGSLTALVILPGFIWYMTELQIKPEEERLSEIFGIDYLDYRARVRRWI